MVFNDQHELIEADYGTGWVMDDNVVETIRQELAEGERKESAYDEQFWFYRSVSGGKMQILLTVPNHTIVDGAQCSARSIPVHDAKWLLRRKDRTFQSRDL